MTSERKFVSLQPIKSPDGSAIRLFALADDGSAWWGKVLPAKGSPEIGVDWYPITPLPKKSIDN